MTALIDPFRAAEDYFCPMLREMGLAWDQLDGEADLTAALGLVDDALRVHESFGKAEGVGIAPLLIARKKRILDRLKCYANDAQPDRRKRTAFIAMAMDPENPRLVDVHAAIKAGARACRVDASRIDEASIEGPISLETRERIATSDFVIVDLTLEKPNVYHEAGCALGMLKHLIYLAEDGATIHFDVRDYQVHRYKNLRGLTKSVSWSLRSLLTKNAFKARR